MPPPDQQNGTAPGDPASRPLIVVGMHRSGTSLLGSLLVGAGIDLGPEMLGAGTGNSRGHFEDLEFLRLHERVMQANGFGVEGYVTEGRIEFPESLAEEARTLAARRMARGIPWGWKEPRTTLLVDFWSRVLPDARYLCVFRRPWEVVDSLLRRGDRVDAAFEAEPGLTAAVWKHYNLQMLALLDRQPDRCLLVESTQLATDPAGLLIRIRDGLGVPVGPSPAVFEPHLFHSDDSSMRPVLVEAACPGVTDLYVELRRRAASGSPVPPSARTPPDITCVGRAALHEWGRAERHVREASAARLHVAELLQALDGAHAALGEAHASLRDCHTHLEANVAARRSLEDTNAALRTEVEAYRRTWHARLGRALRRLIAR